ncbi:MAG: TRZ/ATZ family hydrolase [Methyloversatilis sp.]|jgi:5-methylthioadenosine/S-adenosylhomocysteine deaminase|nr:TRZ/ATZ family hydrolase [Methyloversatilis sp.]MBP6194778.1 TRZ/ATZ family hydrolase [Methyloversatilis sp.]MBP9118184.1 TRZ/ATZ family hydrolase [Methyloversatilis sp.]
MQSSHATIDVDLLIEARWIIPVEPAGVVLEHHSIVVNKGLIVALLPSDEARQRYAARSLRSLGEHVLIPGLVNLHAHAAMNLLRGYADDQPLMRWLTEHIWPAEQRHVSHEFVRDGTLLACAEMLSGGITCFSDMYFFPDAAAEAALEVGMRAALGIVIIEFPSAWATDADQYLSKGLAARDKFRSHPLLHFTLAPHAPYTVSDATFERVRTLAEQLELPVHMHIHETQDEIEQGTRQHGVRPIERLRQLGMIGPGLVGVHAVHLESDEIALLAQEGASVAHCPTSNMKLASGAAPISALHAAGVNIGLGTDGAASNNRLDLFQEMRIAGLLGKLASGDASALPAEQLLHMATLGGARALGLDREIGSLLPGKSADLCAIALDAPETRPCYSPASHIVYAAGREHVSDVWIAGETRVESGILLQMHNMGLKARARLWQNRCGR